MDYGRATDLAARVVSDVEGPRVESKITGQWAANTARSHSDAALLYDSHNAEVFTVG